MTEQAPLHLVIDTNIVLEGLTKQGGASGLIMEAWLGELFIVHISTAIAYEYQDVLTRKLWAKQFLGLTVLSPVELILKLTGDQ